MPQASSSKPLVVATLAVLATAVTLLLWSPWSATEPEPLLPATEPTQLGAGAASATDTPADALREARGAEATDTQPYSSRERVIARATVRGAFAMPAGVWAGDGQALLVVAPMKMRGGAMGMASLGMDVARRHAKQMADRAAGKESNTDFEREMYEAIGRGAPIMSTPIDAQGAFVFEDPPPGPSQVVLDHPLLLNAEREIFDIVAEQSLDLGLLPTRTGAQLLVLVSDSTGHPLPGAKLQLGRPIDASQLMDPSKLGQTASLVQRMIPWEKVTDERGTYDFRGLPVEDPFLLEISAAGFVSAHRSLVLRPGQEAVVSVQLQDGAAVHATVRGSDGAPVPGVRLNVDCPDVALPARIKGLPQMSERTYSRRSESDAEGVARVSGLPAGRAVIEVRTAGFLDQDRTIVLEAGEVTTVDLQLERGTTVTGRLVDESGQPVKHGRVLPVQPQEETFPGLDSGKFMGGVVALRLYGEGARADDEGRFVLGGFRAGDVAAIAAIAPGFDRGETGTIAAGTDGVVITLRRLAELRGVVLADSDGAPVPAFRVELQQRAFLMFERTVRDEQYQERGDGSFAMDDVPRDSFDVVVRAEGYAPWKADADATEGTVDLGEVRLLPPASVSGTTVDADGQPLPGASIRISRGGVADSQMMSQMLGTEAHTSDDEGRFRIDGLTGKRVRLIADKEGYATVRSRPLPLQAGTCTEDVVLQLGTGGSLAGKIVDDDGQPMAGWRVQATHTSGVSMSVTMTGDDGRFVLEGLMPGTTKVDGMPADYVSRITGSAAGSAASSAAGSERVGPSSFNIGKTIGEAMKWIASDRVLVRNGERSEIELVFHRPDDDTPDGTVRVHGTVRVGARQLQRGVVFFTPAGSSAIGRLAQIEGGQFELPRVAPGTYRCRIQAGVLSGAVGKTQTVEIPSGSSHRVDLQMPGGTLAGVVVDTDSNPVPGILVTCASAGADDSFDRMDIGEGSVLTDDEGRFRFEGFAGGRYRVLAREILASGERSALRDVDLLEGAERSDLTLTLSRGGVLRVRVHIGGRPRTNGLVTLLDPFGNPLGLFHRQLTDSSGVVTFGGLPDGDYRVSVDAPGVAPRVSESVWLRDAGEAVVDVELVQGVATRLQFEGEVAGDLGAEMVTYTVRRGDGALVKTGQVMWNAGSSQSANSAAVSIGRLEPGRYTIRVASPRLGVVRGEHVIEQGGESTWPLKLPN